jgi:hypothetical protein
MALPGLVAAKNLSDVTDKERAWDNLGNGINTGEAEALNYISRVEQVDGQPLEAGVKAAIISFVLGCKTDGIWTAIKASCILAGARTLTGALVPLVGTAPTNVSFVSDDYNRKTGLVGNGSTKYLTQTTPAPLQNSVHQAIYLSSAATTAFPDYETHLSQWPASGTDGRTQVTTNTTQTFTRSRETTGNTVSSVGLGLTGIDRSAAGEYRRRILGANTTISASSTGVPSTTAHVFNNPGLGQYSNARLAFYSIGESLDLALLDARVTNLINAFGAAIP